MKYFSFLPLLILLSCSQREVKPPSPVLPVPTEAQLQWHEMETNAFIHFTTNTFTDLEWGNGDESPVVFNPGTVDVDQWMTTLKDAGFKGVILTCKHHDGFCLWPSKYTRHSVKESPYKNGKGDIVKEVAAACKKYGLKFGVYLSPWDRNHAEYGRAPYIDYYRNQLREIFTSYGPVFEMWFDGANGGTGYYGGAKEKRSINGARYYDWPTTLQLVREMEPNVIFFSDAGPGVRWVGNERGVAGETNWNTISPDTLFAGKAGIESLLNTGHENGSHWIPAETDVSIRPGWFYHAREDSLVKSPEKLFEIYLTSVGRGSTLLLNVPPDRRGVIHERDVAALKGWRKLIDNAFANDLASAAEITANNTRGGSDRFAPAKMIDRDKNSYWSTDDNVKSASIELKWSEPKSIQYLVLQEYIKLGQQIKSFDVEVNVGGRWEKVATATTVGYKRIIQFKQVQTSAVRVVINDAKACPVISSLAVY